MPTIELLELRWKTYCRKSPLMAEQRVPFALEVPSSGYDSEISARYIELILR